MSGNENNLYDSQGTGFKRTIINIITESKELKDYTKKQLKEIKEKDFKENKCMSDTQEKQNLMEVMKTTQNLKIQFNKEIETLDKTQGEIEKPNNSTRKMKGKPYK